MPCDLSGFWDPTALERSNWIAMTQMTVQKRLQDSHCHHTDKALAVRGNATGNAINMSVYELNGFHG